jgi:CBS domain-containing protein
MGNLRVKDVMTHLVVMLYPKDTVQEAARRLTNNRISGAPVVEHGKVVGMVSESDLIHASMAPVPIDKGRSVLDALSILGAAHPRAHVHGKTVSEVMSPIVVQISPEAPISTAAEVMDRRGIKRLPVVDDEGFLLGIVSRADLVKSLARSDKQIATDVIDGLRVLGDDVFEQLDVSVKDGVCRLAGRADRRSTRDIAAKIAARIPGVIEVVDRLRFEWDDTNTRVASLRPDPRANWNADEAVREVSAK